MIRTGSGVVLVAIAGVLVVLGGCVSPAGWQGEEDAAAEPVSAPESDVAAPDADVSDDEVAGEEAEAAAQATEEMGSEAQAEAAARVADAEARAADAEARMAAAEARTADAEARSAAAESRTADAESRAADAESRAADAEARTADAEARTADAESRTAHAEARTADAEARAAAADARIAEVAARATDIASRATDVAAKATDAEARLADAEARLASAEAMMTAQQSEIDAQQSEIDAQQSAIDAQQSEIDAQQSEIEMLLRDADGQPVPIPAGLDLNLVSLDAVEVSRAGPDAIYLSGIRYGDREFGALVRYTGDSGAILEALYAADMGELPNMDFSNPAFELVPPNELIISNIGVRGAAYSVSLKVSRDGTIAFATSGQGHRVRTAAELLRDELLIARGTARLVNGFGAGNALPGEGSWTTSGGGAVVRQTDEEASHAKFAIANVVQPPAPTLYGVSASVDGGDRVGYGLHFLASETPASGNTWNYGRSYLVWVTYEPGFFGNDATQVQLYESMDNNELVWRNSRNVAKSMADGLTVEALYDPRDCPEMMAGREKCYGAITVLLDGDEQFKVAVSPAIGMRAANAIALRTLGGPVQFGDLYVHAR